MKLDDQPSRWRRIAVYFGLVKGPEDENARSFGRASDRNLDGCRLGDGVRANAEPSRRRKAAVYFGLADAAGDEPLPGAPRRSRYGLNVRPRLDQDVDELLRRIKDLEARLDDR